jgi:hypothetical protein
VALQIPVKAKLRLSFIVLVVLLLVAFAGAEVPKDEDLKGALADLTTKVEAVDNAGFARATRIMVNALSSGVAASRLDFTADCLVWRPQQAAAASSADILLVALTAGVAQERIFGDPKLALYRGWQNVIKYYQHYHGEGDIPANDAVEKLIESEKKGALLVEAQKVQAKHPALFDRIELAADGRNYADEYPWEGCGTVEIKIPESWTVTYTTHGEDSCTFMVTPKSGSRAEMIISLTQHPKRSGDQAAEIATRMGLILAPLLVYSNERKFSLEPVKMRQGIGFMSQMTGEGLLGKLPIGLKHKVFRLAVGELEDRCTLTVMMQMDAPDIQEAAAMVGMLESTAFARLRESGFMEVVEKDGRYVLTVPAMKLQLTLLKGGFVEAPILPGMKKGPRYFFFTDRSRGWNFSGWFERAERYKGIKEFWRAENRDDKLEARKVSIEKCGPWEVVLYWVELPAVLGGGKGNPKMVGHEMRAECVQADTWIDLHFSVVSASPRDEIRSMMRTFLQSLKVEEKPPASATGPDQKNGRSSPIPAR